MEKIIEAQKELLAFTFSQAQAYTNLIIVAGYAGFFALWNFVQDDITKTQLFWSGILITISLIVFVLWEVYGMFRRSRSLLEISEAVNKPNEFEELIRSHKQKESERAISYGRTWIAALSITVLTGFSAIGIMLWSFISGLLKIYANT